ncbi:DUF3800 domain-containing protein [Nesterenkonia ebinurensis]
MHPSISYEDSRAHLGLQVADFVAYFSRRHLEAHKGYRQECVYRTAGDR